MFVVRELGGVKVASWLLGIEGVTLTRINKLGIFHILVNLRRGARDLGMVFGSIDKGGSIGRENKGLVIGLLECI